MTRSAGAVVRLATAYKYACTADCTGILKCRYHKRRPGACRNSQKHIVPGEFFAAKGFHRSRSGILSTLDRVPHCVSRPPAITACTVSGSVPKVGGHSAASITPSRPLVPAPTKKTLPPRSSDRKTMSAAREMESFSPETASKSLQVFRAYKINDFRTRKFIYIDRSRVYFFCEKVSCPASLIHEEHYI